ncbi:MAG: hypothetical protein ACFB12_10890 [Leptolyngbyaceae cyanobacterium]
MLQWGLVNRPEVTQFCGDTQASNVASRRVMENVGWFPSKQKPLFGKDLISLLN